MRSNPSYVISKITLVVIHNHRIRKQYIRNILYLKFISISCKIFKKRTELLCPSFFKPLSVKLLSRWFYSVINIYHCSIN